MDEIRITQERDDYVLYLGNRETQRCNNLVALLEQLPTIVCYKGCCTCKHRNMSGGEYPCKYCKKTAHDYYEKEEL